MENFKKLEKNSTIFHTKENKMVNLSDILLLAASTIALTLGILGAILNFISL